MNNCHVSSQAGKHSSIRARPVPAYPTRRLRPGAQEVGRRDVQRLRHGVVSPTRRDTSAREQRPRIRRDAVRLLERRRDDVYHALVRLSSLSDLSDRSVVADHRDVCSGHHPFDYGRAEDEDEDSQLEPLNSWEEKASLSYVRNDRRVRRRIIDGDAEFPADIWGSLQDGNLSRPIPLPSTARILTRSLYLLPVLVATILCDSLLTFNPQERATVYEAFESNWIQCDIEELSSVFVQRVNGD